MPSDSQIAYQLKVIEEQFNKDGCSPEHRARLFKLFISVWTHSLSLEMFDFVFYERIGKDVLKPHKGLVLQLSETDILMLSSVGGFFWQKHQGCNTKTQLKFGVCYPRLTLRELSQVSLDIVSHLSKVTPQIAYHYNSISQQPQTT